MSKRHYCVSAFLTGALLAMTGGAHAQQEYPSRPVRIVVPYPPSGSVDYVARVFSAKLAETFGKQFPVDNRGGGNSIIGMDIVAKAPPDGYTLLVAAGGQVTIPHLYRKLPFDALNDFAPIAGIAHSQFLLLVHPTLPVNTLADLIALTKKRPGELNYATSSTGGPTHLGAVQFEMAAKVRMQQVPYKGGGPAMTDLLGGQVQLVFANPASSITFVKAKRVKALAVTGDKRLEALPEVPTFAEAGVPGVTITNWYAMTAPAGTPKPIIDKLAGAILKFAAMPDVKAALAKQGLDSFSANPEQLDRLRREDYAEHGKLIKAANIKPLD
jgi:tripartite-type tricarboxylate transporter receptor subunit TctC